MRKGIFGFVAAVFVFACCGRVLALSPLGKTVSDLDKGQWSVGADYGYGKSDIQVNGTVAGLDIDGTVEDVTTNTFVGRAAYGLTDNWQLYGLAGAGNADVDFFEGSYDITYGFGSKYTFIKEEKVSFGLFFQMQWLSTDDSGVEDGEDFDIDLDFYEILAGVGPTFELSENCRCYAGPFYYFLNGDLDVQSSSLAFDDSLDLDTESEIGALIGLEHDLTERTDIFVEFLFTDDMSLIGVGLNCKL